MGKTSVNSVAFDPKSQYIVVGSNDGKVSIWNLLGKPIGKPFSAHPKGGVGDLILVILFEFVGAGLAEIFKYSGIRFKSKPALLKSKKGLILPFLGFKHGDTYRFILNLNTCGRVVS